MKQTSTEAAGVKGMGVVTDPIADMMTRIRNAAQARHANVKVPVSKMKREIAKILHEEGYIRGFQLVGKGQSLRIRLKYDANREPVLRGLKRVSKPGRRVYVGKDLLLRLGFSHTITVTPRPGITFEVAGNTNVIVKGIDKELVGQTAAEIRKLRKVEPYRGKGIRYEGEIVRRKAGKTKVGG